MLICKKPALFGTQTGIFMILYMFPENARKAGLAFPTMEECGMFWYGILAFGVFLLHDLNCKSHNNERLLSLFPVGAGLLGLSILSQAQGGQAALPAAVRIIMGVLALFFLVLLVYTVFFAVQPKKQDRKKQASRPWWETPLVDTGVYALCRAPGGVVAVPDVPVPGPLHGISPVLGGDIYAVGPDPCVV